MLPQLRDGGFRLLGGVVGGRVVGHFRLQDLVIENLLGDLLLGQAAPREPWRVATFTSAKPPRTSTRRPLPGRSVITARKPVFSAVMTGAWPGSTGHVALGGGQHDGVHVAGKEHPLRRDEFEGETGHLGRLGGERWAFSIASSMVPTM